MINKTKITYLKNDTVKLVMSMDDYRSLLQGNIDLKSATEMMGECHTIYLEDLGKLDTLEWRMARVLGFRRKRSSLITSVHRSIKCKMSF